MTGEPCSWLGRRSPRFAPRASQVTCFSGDATPTHLVVAAVLNGCFQAEITPSQQSLMPRLVEPADLRNALGLISAGGNMTPRGRSGLVGVLIAALGTGYPFLVQAIALLAAFVIVLRTPFPTLAAGTVRMSWPSWSRKSELSRVATICARSFYSTRCRACSSFRISRS